MRAFLIGGVLIVLAGVIGVLFGFWQQWSKTPLSQDPSAILFEVTSRSTWRSVARDLHDQGYLLHPDLLLISARLKGSSAVLKAGEYQLRKNMTPNEIMKILSSGVSYGRELRISEGLNMFEIAELFEKGGFGKKDEFLALARDRSFASQALGYPVSSLEGYLFPQTYRLTRYNTVKDLIQMMIRNHQRAFEESVGTNSFRGLNRHQLVTLASIVEKETGAPEERPLIASVFYNRLDRKMRLQTDPTIIYGLALILGRIPTNITKENIRQPTDYNTYVISGLPPGPIANPGAAALRAVREPATSSYLFFVSKNDGTHVFSETYSDHNEAVNEFQRNSKNREGKSWRDLQKNRNQKPTP